MVSYANVGAAAKGRAKDYDYLPFPTQTWRRSMAMMWTLRKRTIVANFHKMKDNFRGFGGFWLNYHGNVHGQQIWYSIYLIHKEKINDYYKSADDISKAISVSIGKNWTLFYTPAASDNYDTIIESVDEGGNVFIILRMQSQNRTIVMKQTSRKWIIVANMCRIKTKTCWTWLARMRHYFKLFWV